MKGVGLLFSGKICTWAALLTVFFVHSIVFSAAAQQISLPAGKRKDFPCPGCTAIIPAGNSPQLAQPMFVVLHGDEGSLRVVLQLWEKPLEQRNIILLALRCPKALGCVSSYWQWGGDFDWIVQQSEAVMKAYSVDRDRVYLSGWSGGSTYIGMNEPKWGDLFAAININAGGSPPVSGLDCAPCKTPVYYFMGGKNPLIELAESTRNSIQRCGHRLEWDFHPGLNHGGELRLLSSEATKNRILDWLLTQRRSNNGCGASATPPLPALLPSAEPSASSSLSASSAPLPNPSNAGPPASAFVPARGGCACSWISAFISTESHAMDFLLGAALLSFVFRVSARRAPHRLQSAAHNRGEGPGIH